MSSKRRTFRLSFAAAAVLLVALAVLLTGVLSRMGGARIDLTQDKIYTMSPAAKKILSELKVPVQVKLYITGSDKMPTELKTLERDITDKLEDYRRASGGMLEYAVYDPQDNEEMQNDLTSRGIRPFQVQSIDKDEIGVKLVWSAITIAYKDYPEEVIPQVLPQSLSTLEYDLISRIYRLTREKNPKVALVAPKQEVDPQVAMMYLQQGMQPPQPQDVYTQAVQLLQQEHYDVQRVDLTADSRIPDDADVLVVLNPTRFNERQAFEINRALSNGLNTVIAVQQHTYDYQPGYRGGFTVSGIENPTGLDSLLAAFGVPVSHDHLFDTSIQVLSIPRTQSIGGLRFQTNEPVRLPMQILVTSEQMNHESPLTNRIGSLLYLWGTALQPDQTKLDALKLERTVLFTSSPNTWTVEFAPSVVPGSDFNPNGKEMVGPQPLAMLLEGQFPDTWQGKETPAWPDSDQVGEVAPLELQPAKLILVGCAKMFDDMALQAGQNALLLLNCVDALAHGEDLISIRSKALTQRTIRPVGESQKLLFRLFTVVLVPVLLAIYGLVRAGRRRKEAAQ